MEFCITTILPLVEGIVKKCLNESHIKNESKYLYGVEAIAKHFNISKRTVQNYKKTWLAPAISKRGRHVQLDIQKADELFGAYKGTFRHKLKIA